MSQVFPSGETLFSAFQAVVRKCLVDGAGFLVGTMSCISPYSFRPICFLNFTGALKVVWKYAFLFSESSNYFCYFFGIFNLCLFRALILQKCLWSMHLVLATLPTVLGRSFSSFTCAFKMIWRCACSFIRILKIFVTVFAF